MNISDRELAGLRQQIATLNLNKAAADAQRELLEKVLAVAQSPARENVLNMTLQDILDISSKLTGAEKGSLFLLDREGAVTESILTQRETAQDIRQRLIGTILDQGLAGWVKHHRQPGLIADTETDDRWLTLANQPYVVRSALAVPILRGDELLGILSLLHSQPNHFSSTSADLMVLTANQTALVLENAQLYRNLEASYHSLDRAKQKVDAYSKALDDELEKGRQIQCNFLPSTIPQLPNWDIAASFYPARQVAGDFYDVFTFPNNYIGLVIADVCDKGVGAALFMALFRSLIRVFSGQANLAMDASISGLRDDEIALTNSEMVTELNPIDVLKAVSRTNDYIATEHAEMSMFATLFFGLLNPVTGTLTYINGGHEPLLILNNGLVKHELTPTGPAVGMMPQSRFRVEQVQLASQDILFGYTDGVTEARNSAGKLYTSTRLRSLLEQPTASASELLKRIEQALAIYTSETPQFDDITMLAVQFLDFQEETEK